MVIFVAAVVGLFSGQPAHRPGLLIVLVPLAFLALDRPLPCDHGVEACPLLSLDGPHPHADADRRRRRAHPGHAARTTWSAASAACSPSRTSSSTSSASATAGSRPACPTGSPRWRCRRTSASRPAAIAVSRTSAASTCSSSTTTPACPIPRFLVDADRRCCAPTPASACCSRGSSTRPASPRRAAGSRASARARPPTPAPSSRSGRAPCSCRAPVFDATGGWAEPFFYAHEGIELAWRVWDQGLRAWYAGDLVANHPVIQPTRHADYYRLNARNRVWLARRNLPAPLDAALRRLLDGDPGAARRPQPAGACEPGSAAGGKAGRPTRASGAPLSARTIWRMTRGRSAPDRSPNDSLPVHPFGGHGRRSHRGR